MTVSEHASVPYADVTDRLQDELVRVDLLLRRHLEARWSERNGADEGLGGLYVSDAEVDGLLATECQSSAAMNHSPDNTDRTVGSTGIDDAIDRLAELIETRAASTTESTRVGQLADTFDLDRHQLDVLLLALAPDLEEKYQTVYGYLRDDVTRRRPTVGILLSVLAAAGRDRFAERRSFESGSTLVDAGLVSIAEDGTTFVSRTVTVPRRVGSYLTGGDELPGPLADEASFVRPECGLEELSVDKKCRTRLASLAETLTDSKAKPQLAAFVGPAERAAGEAVEAVCASADRAVVRLPASSLRGDGRDTLLGMLGRELRLLDAVACVTGIGALEDDADPTTEGSIRSSRTDEPLTELVGDLEELAGDVFITGDADLTARVAPRLSRHAFVAIPFPRPDSRQREAIWACVDDLPAEIDPTELASTFRLTRGEIEDAVHTARSLADGEMTADTLRAGCRAHASQDLTEHAREVDPGYDWDDIVLPADAKAHLREAAAHVRHRGTVFENWGFEDRFSRGNGVTILFTGPSGTGKTMAAEILANDAGLPLFALDIASLVSKYIGETEKNLSRVFDAAERSNAILFFDEADALFGERSEVSDAHDRYANVEVDYLLQRLEAHDGCVVLASNLEENIDDAFRRRINLTVSFPYPDRTARAAIWRDVFPSETPVAEINVPFLADFELTGGNIRNVATTAAFFAVEDDAAVRMAHLVRALRRELQKTGRLFERSDFGEYSDHLPET